MAPVFFIGKNNGKKRMVQDYRYLNEWTFALNIECSRKYWYKESIYKDGLEMGL